MTLHAKKTALEEDDDGALVKLTAPIIISAPARLVHRLYKLWIIGITPFAPVGMIAIPECHVEELV